MLTIKKVEVWETSDGVVHASKEMAEQHICNNIFRDDLKNFLSCILSNTKAQDILNFLSGRPQQVREWLDANDAAEKASLR